MRPNAPTSLVLRWPTVAISPSNPDLLVVDVVNIGVERYIPHHQDAFYVVGKILPAGAEANGIGWAALSQPRALPLDPGEYARLPVVMRASMWRELEPGGHEVHAWLVSLDLPAPVLPIELTAEQIEMRCAEAPQADSTHRRRLLEEEIARCTAVLEAGPYLGALIREVGSATIEETAIEGIAHRLASDRAAAQSVLNAPLRDLLPFGADRLRMSIDRARVRLDGIL